MKSRAGDNALTLLIAASNSKVTAAPVKSGVMVFLFKAMFVALVWLKESPATITGL